MRILQFHTDSHPYSLGKARRRVRDALMQAGLSVEVARNMEVAVGEALANTYEHAYDSSIGPVSVKVFRGAGGLTVEVHDDGRATVAPSVPRTVPVSTSLEGRGLYIVDRLVDDVAISVNPGGHGLTVRMMMRLGDADAARAHREPFARRVEGPSSRPSLTASASAEQFRGDEITNLVADALEQEAPDERLTRIVTALGLLLASLNPPRGTQKGPVELPAAAAQFRTPREVLLQSHTDSHLYSLAKARRNVRNVLLETGFGAAVAQDMEVAVGEVLANVHEHAYDAGVGPVSIKVFCAAGALTVVVNDNGRATVVPSIPLRPPPSASYRGRGLYMVGRLVDDVAVSVNPAGHGLTIQMTMRLEDRERKSKFEAATRRSA